MPDVRTYVSAAGRIEGMVSWTPRCGPAGEVNNPMASQAARGPFCVAETRHGKVQGLINSGVHQFRGVPYGASTGGVNRFKAPRPPAPWTGTRECFGHGPVAPQLPTELTHRYGRLIHLDLAVAEGGIGEDCLRLNVWTPGWSDGIARPVMFCIHGGGFAISSGNAPLYDGAQLARTDQVVVVSVTHRLAAFGFLNLRDVGAPAEFAAAGVTGIMDLVLALEWVRDNIGAFGGDPRQVMIFGQSGGGWKTSVLLATPAAQGLFHRAAIQSGSLLRLQTRAASAQAASAMLDALGLTPKTVERIRDLPWQTVLAAQAQVGAHLFAPVLDEQYLPQHPCDPRAPAESAGVPLIISTTLDDASLFFDNFDLDEQGLRAWLAARYGSASNGILDLYRSKWPRKSSFLLQAQIITDAGFRRFAQTQAERESTPSRAAVYCYRWDWATPAMQGLYGAAHATDVAASLANYRDAIIGGGTSPGRVVAKALAASWVAFAVRGDPNNDKIPRWPAFTPTRRDTMIFDERLRAESDPDAELRALWETMPPAQTVYG
jgi:para-nitrobenzyl esterase